MKQKLDTDMLGLLGLAIKLVTNGENAEYSSEEDALLSDNMPRLHQLTVLVRILCDENPGDADSLQFSPLYLPAVQLLLFGKVQGVEEIMNGITRRERERDEARDSPDVNEDLARPH